MTVEQTVMDFSNLLKEMKISVRYHKSRFSYYEFCADLFSIVSVVGGAAAIASVLGETEKKYIVFFTAIVAIIQALDLVMRPSKKARLHSDIARRVLALQQKALDLEFDLTDRKVATLRSELLDIEMEEPPTLKWLSIRSQNEEERAEKGASATIVPINPIQRLFINQKDIFDSSVL